MNHNETSSLPCTIGDKGIDVFASQPRTCPFVVELFAGSGRVTAHLKHVGVKASFGVDHQQLSKIAPIQVCDLSTLSGHACSGASHRFWQVSLQRLRAVLVARQGKYFFEIARVDHCLVPFHCEVKCVQTGCHFLNLLIGLVCLQQMDCMISWAD